MLFLDHLASWAMCFRWRLKTVPDGKDRGSGPAAAPDAAARRGGDVECADTADGTASVRNWRPYRQRASDLCV